jgi:hypothetical protein
MKKLSIPILALLGALALASSASALQLLGPEGDPAYVQTRDGYVESVEPICKTNKESSDRYLKDVRNLVKNDKLKQAAESFTKAASALQLAQGQLAAVPQPAADASKLTKWLSGIKAEVVLMKTIASKLRVGSKGKASSLVVRLTREATFTNNLVIVFQFSYCKIDPSKYT